MENSQFNKARSKIFYGYIIVLAASMIFAVSYGVHYAFTVFFKPMLTEFGWSRAMTSGAFSLSWLLQGPSCIIMGRLNDRHGSRVVLTLCGIFLSAGYLLIPLTKAPWHLYLSYGVCIGVGTGGIYVPLVSTIARWFIVRRSVMTGIAVSGIGIGTFLVPPVANDLITLYDWRTSYTILGIGVLLVIVFAAQFLRREPGQMGLLPYGHEESVQNASPGGDKRFSLRDAFYTLEFWLVFGMFFCFGFCLFSIMVHLAPHATDVGKSTATAASFVATIGVASIFGKILLGSVGDRIGNRHVYTICFALMTGSLFLLMTVKETWLLYVFATGFGIAYGGSATSQSPLIASLFGLHSHGLIMGVANNGFTIGATLGPVATGSIFDATGSYRIAFLVTAGVAIMGLLLTLCFKPNRANL